MKKITLYTTVGCPDCAMLKRWFKDKSISFIEIDIAKGTVAEFIKKTYGVRVAPVTVIGDMVFYGTFNIQRPQLEKILI